MSRIRIIHLQVLPIFSGVQKSMYELLVRLDRRKYEITVLCQSEGDLTEVLKQNGIKYIVLPELRREINPYYDLLAFFKLYKFFKQERYDLVHTHSSKPGFIGRLAAKAARVKCVIHTVQGFAFHEHSPKLIVFVVGILERIAGLAATKVIFVNDNDRRTALEKKLLPPEKMVTIYNGIDLDSFNSSNSAGDKGELIGIEKNGALVGMVARLWKQKAPQDYIRSIPTVVREFPTAQFLVIGDGPMQSELEKLSEELGVRENVIFMGWRKDVKDLLKLIDVFVLPSLWEGLPNSILEAMAASKPVVATNIKGNNEIVVPGETGFLVPPKNPEKIGECVVKLLKDRALAEKMGQRGYQRVKEKFDINETVHRMTLEYETLLNGKL